MIRSSTTVWDVEKAEVLFDEDDLKITIRISYSDGGSSYVHLSNDEGAQIPVVIDIDATYIRRPAYKEGEKDSDKRNENDDPSDQIAASSM